MQVATLISVYAHISFASVRGIGWGWAGIIWVYSVIFYIPLDIIKFTVRYALSGEAWNLIFDRKVCTPNRGGSNILSPILSFHFINLLLDCSCHIFFPGTIISVISHLLTDTPAL